MISCGKKIVGVLLILFYCTVFLGAETSRSNIVQFVFLSDPHYGITRAAFRGANNVDAQAVNSALVAKLNGISSMKFAADTGVNAGKEVGATNFLIVAGDISTRQEGTEKKATQSASKSWEQFKIDYLEGVTLKTPEGTPSPFYLIPGNNDVSNAIGFYKPMYPTTDETVMVEIYNRHMRPSVQKTSDTYDYPADNIRYSFDFGGIHFVCISTWPDSVEREWLDQDLKAVPKTMPVVLITHDQLEVEARHFTNPNGSKDINAGDKFENLLADTFKSGNDISTAAVEEQRELEAFLRAYPNVTLNLHGHDHARRFSDWVGPDGTVAVNMFGGDSPMKGTVSSKDETKLSFLIVTIDTKKNVATVRECLWNADPTNPNAPCVWGETITVALFPRPPLH